MAYRLSNLSRGRMVGLHPDLIRVIEGAIARTPVDFRVTEGLRSAERQAQLVKAGASQTLNSRHLSGHAVDVAAMVGPEIRWDWPLYPLIAEAFKAEAKAQGIALIWGGDWPKLRDGPHFELDRRAYP